MCNHVANAYVVINTKFKRQESRVIVTEKSWLQKSQTRHYVEEKDSEDIQSL